MNNDYDPTVDECVDPDLGDEMWQADDPSIDPKLKNRLDAHLAICAACRLRVAHKQAVADGLRSGSLSADDPSPLKRWPAHLLVGAGILAIAASLLMMFMLPPSNPSRVLRAEDPAPRLLAPLPGEVVINRSPEIRWTVTEGARSYDLTVYDDGGALACSLRTVTPSARVGTDRPLVRGQDYRIRLAAVPAFAAGEPLRGSFRVGTWSEFLKYRLDVARPWYWLPALLGLVGLGLGIRHRTKA